MRMGTHEDLERQRTVLLVKELSDLDLLRHVQVLGFCNFLCSVSGVDLVIVGEAAADEARISKGEGDVSDGHAQRHAALPLLARMPQPQQAHVRQRAACRAHLRRRQRLERHLFSQQSNLLLELSTCTHHEMLLLLTSNQLSKEVLTEDWCEEGSYKGEIDFDRQHPDSASTMLFSSTIL